jgi:Rrf2 family protein
VPEGYLAKVLRNLALAELVRSQRGPQGGSVLTRAIREITVLDVVQAVDPIKRITTCPLGIKSHGVHLCPLHRRLDQAIAMVEDTFRKTTIAELIAGPASTLPLCDLTAKGRPVSRVRT